MNRGTLVLQSAAVLFGLGVFAGPAAAQTDARKALAYEASEKGDEAHGSGDRHGDLEGDGGAEHQDRKGDAGLHIGKREAGHAGDSAIRNPASGSCS